MSTLATKITKLITDQKNLTDIGLEAAVNIVMPQLRSLFKDKSLLYNSTNEENIKLMADLEGATHVITQYKASLEQQTHRLKEEMDKTDSLVQDVNAAVEAYSDMADSYEELLSGHVKMLNAIKTK